ncbi:hypothetical protein [Mitsuokella jalaludinii]|uniref:hypothetical protein n=1 Tax=Mitsuokella jalaludinii TaxID=187979 RepID=UPI002431E769|nr:hypothetical protein [Mitsuokella jalaludinii]
MKFVIVSPKQTGGGPIVLYKLAKTLQEQGYDASVFNIGGVSDNRIEFYYKQLKYDAKESIKYSLVKLFPKSNFTKRHYQGYAYLPVRGCRKKYLPVVDDDTVVIYPEILRGNPLHAKHVVRWLLYHNRFPNDSTWYSDTDLFVAYREQFNDSQLNPDGNLLKIFSFDRELYKRTNYGERNGVCYFIRKGSKRTDLPKHFDGPVLDLLPETEKVRILNKCEKCYLYDTQTFYASIAALCGCHSIVVPEPGKTRKDYLKKDDHSCGVAYGENREEIEYAIQTQEKVADRIDRMLSSNLENTISFINLCKKCFHLS